jgi:hypothetical protein
MEDHANQESAPSPPQVAAGDVTSECALADRPHSWISCGNLTCRTY